MEEITENDKYVFLIINEMPNCQCVKLGTGIYIGKKKKVDPVFLIGMKWGVSFLVNDNGSVEPIDKDAFYQGIIDSCCSDENQNDDRNNQHLSSICGEGVQKYNADDIVKLKEKNLGIDKVIKMIVEGSSSFKSKTPFSQRKYVLKKIKKHCHIITVYKPTIPLLAEMFYQNKPNKIFNLRPDVLAQLLYYAEISSNSKVLVFDGTNGLISASVLNRIDKNGSLCMAFDKNKKNDFVFKYLNIQTDIQNFFSIPLAIQNGKNKIGDIKEDSFDSVIFCLPINLDQLYEIVQIRLQRPCSVVIFHQFREPLILMYIKLKLNPQCIDLNLSETWFRSYQFEENKSHPNNSMDGSGGFLLRFRKIVL